MSVIKVKIEKLTEVHNLNYNGKTYLRHAINGDWANPSITPPVFSIEGIGAITPDDTHTLTIENEAEIHLDTDDLVICSDGSFYAKEIKTGDHVAVIKNV